MKYTSEELEWVRQNYPIYNRHELAENYNKVFENKRTWRGLDSLGKWLGLKKETVNSFTEEETMWLINNYDSYEPTEITFQRFVDTFGNHHTFCAIEGKVKQLKLNKSKKMTMLQYEWLKTHDEIPLNCYLVKCGKEIIDIPKDIYNCLNGRGLLGKGEITKTMVEIYKAKKEIENISGERVFKYHPTKEHLQHMNSFPKTYHRKFEGEKLKELIELYNSGIGVRKLGKKYGCSHSCITGTLKRNNVVLRKGSKDER